MQYEKSTVGDHAEVKFTSTTAISSGANKCAKKKTWCFKT